MYESFYKLRKLPFRLTPDPHFFFRSTTHGRGLAHLHYALEQGEGFVVITGSPGTGKTELTLNLLNEIPRSRITFAKIVTTSIDAGDIMYLVAASFNIPVDGLNKGLLIKKLENFLISQAQKKHNCVLLIDEAHNLTTAALVELSMLSNFQVGDKPVLQYLLLGHESLECKLGEPELMHLKQRIIASSRLEPISESETRDYIEHRLRKVGWNGSPHFSNAAHALIYLFSGGIPRQINSICNRLMLKGYIEEKNAFDKTFISELINELEGEKIFSHAEYKKEQLEAIIQQCDQEEFVVEDLTAAEVIPPKVDQAKVVIPEKNQAAQVFEAQSSALAHADQPAVNQPSVSSELVFLPFPADSVNKRKKPKAKAAASGKRPTKGESQKVMAVKHGAAFYLIPITVVFAGFFAIKSTENENSIESAMFTTNTNAAFSTGVANADGVLYQRAISAKTEQSVSAKAEQVVINIEETVSDDLPLVSSDSFDAAQPVVGEYEQVKAVEEKALNIDASQIEGSPEPKPVISVTTNALPVIESEAIVEFPEEVIEHKKPEQTAEAHQSLVNNNTATLAAAEKISEQSIVSSDMKPVFLNTSAELDTDVVMNPRSFSEPSEIVTKQKQPSSDSVEIAQVSAETHDNLKQAERSEDKSVNAEVFVDEPTYQLASLSAVALEPAELILRKPVTKHEQRADMGSANQALELKKTPLISEVELNTLLSKLTFAYEAGDLDQFISYFEQNAHSNESASRKDIYDDYKKLFDVTDYRKMEFENLRWIEINHQMKGVGKFKISVREKGANYFEKIEGDISLVINKDNNMTAISELNYQYND